MFWSRFGALADAGIDFGSPGVVGGISVVLVAILTGLGGWASQKAAARASTLNASTSARVDMERDAYIRARAMDVETITRQDMELIELHGENKELRARVKGLETRNNELQRRVFRLETSAGIRPKKPPKESTDE